MARNASKRVRLPDISFTAQVWKEGATFVAYSPELDVASCSVSLSKARTALHEALSLFLVPGREHDLLPVFIIKNVLRTAGISRERYFELLEMI